MTWTLFFIGIGLLLSGLIIAFPLGYCFGKVVAYGEMMDECEAEEIQ